ncbi:TPA: hypothetical protein ACT5CR_007264, partial [Burkholderia cenocepacia]
CFWVTAGGSKRRRRFTASRCRPSPSAGRSTPQDRIVALVDELSQGTIDRNMGMSDTDPAATVLSGRLNTPMR